MKLEKIPSLTPKTPQTQYTSRFAAILFLREERNAAYMTFGMEALPDGKPLN